MQPVHATVVLPESLQGFFLIPLHICEAALEVKGHLHHRNDMVVIEQLCPGIRGRENYLRSKSW